MSESASTLLGIPRRPFWGLLGLFVRLELRSQAYGRAVGAKAKDVIPPLYWVVAQFLATSMLFSLVLFMRVNVAFFALANLALTLLLVFSALVVEFHEAVLDPADAQILGHRPIRAATYAAARGSTLLAYVALMTATLSIFPAVLGAVLRDSSFGFLIAYPIAAALTGLAAAAVVVLLYLVFQGERWMSATRQVLAWTQIIGVMVAFYGGQLMLRNGAGSIEHFAAVPPSWVWMLPVAPLARFVAAAAAGDGATMLAHLGGSVAVVAVLSAWAGYRLTVRWSQLSRRPTAASAQDATLPVPPKQRVAWPWRGLMADRSELAGFWLARLIARRDTDLAARAWPQLGTAVALVAVGYLTGQLADPWRATGVQTALVLAVATLVASSVPALLVHLGSSCHYQASWLLASAPVRRRSVNRGARLALYPAFVLPLLFAIFVVFALSFRRVDTAALECLWVLMVVEAVSAIAARDLMVDLPFARPVVRGASMGKASLYGAFAGLATATVAGVRFAVGPNVIGQVSLLVVAAMVMVVARRIEVRDG